MHDIVIASFGSLVGALLGSLGTIVAFGGRVHSLELLLKVSDRDLGEVKRDAEKATVSADRAWNAVRELRTALKYVTQEHPKYEPPRDSGETPSV